MFGFQARRAVFVGLFAIAGCGGGDSAFEGQSAGAGGGGLITGAGGGGGSAPGTSGATTSTSSSATTGAGGDGGGDPNACPAVGPYDGPVMHGDAGKWTWVSFPDAHCRDGSETGIGIRLNPNSDRLFIYLEGGGACFNGATCAISLGAFGGGAFAAWAGSAGNTGIFNSLNPDNPMKDWNAVYVPYCTGDIHGGDNPGADVPGGPKDQMFVGYANVGKYLRRIIPTFKHVEQVVLTGISAGGFGAAYNYERVLAAFCPTPVVLIDDSGPPMSDEYLAPCLQEKWRELWNLDKTLPADCAACKGAPDGGGIVNYVDYLQKKHPKARAGLISSTHDAVISTFFGFGTNDCTQSTPMSGAEYEAGLDDLRANHFASSGLWGSYYINSISHTWLVGPAFYTTKVSGVRLTDWVAAMIDGQPANVGP